MKQHHQDYGPMRTWGRWQQMQHTTLHYSVRNSLTNSGALCFHSVQDATWVQQGTLGKCRLQNQRSLSSHRVRGRPGRRVGCTVKLYCQSASGCHSQTLIDQPQFSTTWEAKLCCRRASRLVRGSREWSTRAAFTRSFIRCMVTRHASPPTRTQPTIDLSIRLCNACNF